MNLIQYDTQSSYITIILNNYPFQILVQFLCCVTFFLDACYGTKAPPRGLLSNLYSISHLLWYVSQIRIYFLKTCPASTSSRHVWTSVKRCFIILDKLQMLWYIHTNDYIISVLFLTLSAAYVIVIYAVSLLNSHTPRSCDPTQFMV